MLASVSAREGRLGSFNKDLERGRGVGVTWYVSWSSSYVFFTYHGHLWISFLNMTVYW
jgi:hypothetical protein